MYKQVRHIAEWLSRKRVLLFVLVFSMLLLALSIYRFDKRNQWLETEFEVQIQNIELNSGIAKLNLYLKKAESADRGYIISGNPEFLETFDADIDSIYAIYLSIQQLQNRKDHEQDGPLFLKSDKLIKQKIAFMQRIKLLCDQHNNKAAAALLATNEGLHLADSILKINKQISDNIQGRLKKSQSGFLTLNKTNRSLAFSAMVSSLVLIVLIFYLLMQEVRETKKIAGELLIRKQFYQTTLSSLNEGLITTDKEGNIEYINSAAERLTGWRWQEAKNQPLHTVFDVVNEKTGKPFENIVNRVLQYGTAIGLENNTLLKTKDARTYIISNNGAPLFDVNGQIAGAVLVFNDITEKYRIEKQLKDSEEKYRSLFEQASDAILIYSFDGTIHEFNKACYSMLGYSKEEYAKLKLTDILVEEIIVDRDNYAAILDGETRTVYRSLRRKDGSLLETEVTVKMLADGKAIAFARDVTERKKAEQSLRESEIFSRSILTSINYHIAVVEANGNIISVNKAWNDFSIANGEAVLERTGVGSNYIDVCSVSAGKGDTSAAKALKGFQQVIKKEIPFFEMEYPCHSMDEQRWFLLRIVNFAEGSPKVVMMHIDITELKNAGEVVSNNEKRFRAMIENNNGIIALVDENFKTIYRSPSAGRITGWTIDELASMGIENVIHPDDRNLLKKTWADLIANPGKLQTLSIRTLHKNGNYIYLEGTAINLLDDKSVKAIVTNMLDVTERMTAEILMKKAIERYDILSEATSDTIWDWDIKNNWMQYNEGIGKMFGYNASDVANVVEWRNEKLHVDDYQRVVESFEDVFEKKMERLQLQYRFRCADGTYKHIFDRAFVLFDDDGNPARMIGAMQDITYRVEEEKRISKAIIDAQEQERNYIGAELHDNVNQILVGTMLTLSMAKSKEVNTSRQTEFIESAMGYINDAIRETRKLSHNLAPASFDDRSLKEIFEDLLLSINLDDRFVIDLHFDEIKETLLTENIKINLYRILQEQTKNIVKYAEASAIEIALKIVAGTVILRIFDNGKGFNTKTIKCGIGLSNIKKRAEALNGKFILNSEPGKGCEIIVEIPPGN